MQRCSITRHVHHPAFAHTLNLKSLAAQAAGADTVGIVTRDHLLTGGAAVPPRLGQVGQLHTEKERERAVKRTRETDKERLPEQETEIKRELVHAN